MTAISGRTEFNGLATAVYVAGPQIKVGAFAISYIPTTTVAVTRAGDCASIKRTNFNSWYNPVEVFGAQF